MSLWNSRTFCALVVGMFFVGLCGMSYADEDESDVQASVDGGSTWMNYTPSITPPLQTKDHDVWEGNLHWCEIEQIYWWTCEEEEVRYKVPASKLTAAQKEALDHALETSPSSAVTIKINSSGEVVEVE